MGEGWTFGGEPVTTPVGTVTLVEGSSFCLSTSVGDVSPDQAQGLFARDLRLLSTWQLRLDGLQLQPLAVLEDLPFRATFLSRLPGLGGMDDPGLVLERTRTVSAGMHEQLRLRNDGPRHRRVTLELWVDADLADVFEVKESRVRRRPPRRVQRDDEIARIGDGDRVVRIAAPGSDLVCEARGGRLVSAEDAPARLRWDVELAPRGEWTVDLDVSADLDGHALTHGHGHEAASRLRTWTDEAPVLQGGDDALRTVLETARQDLGALRITDPEHPDEHPVAAGAPWFMALFGRDSLLTSYMTLPVDPRLASSTLRVLARQQGSRTDRRTEEEPGRILHEMRFGDDAAIALGGGRAYYGSVDATPLFVLVLGELRRWGLRDEAVRELLPAADRALAWCAEHGDRDGDGFIEYLRASDDGLPHQGWRDSADAITFADGTPAEPPLALAEVQGYWYGALRARAAIARSLGQDGCTWDRQADDLQRRFDEAFWVAERSCYAVALDERKRPVDSVTSGAGHCLWSGIVPSERAAEVGRTLLSPEMFTGWGLRTLSSAMGAYDPLGYHTGGVWPHDTALAAAGLAGYGLVEEARRLSTALLHAAAALGGRLPELLCGFDGGRYGTPIPYPAACSPQAWASASPVLALRTLLRLDVDVPAGVLWCDPVLPPAWRPMVLAQVPLGGRRVRLAVDESGHATVTGLPPTLTLQAGPRHSGAGAEGGP
jgi:glycogen debranching enzyme